ncbi:MAG: hypothetical protein AAF970_14515, partial [Bacteroidota bacterium]
MSLFTAIRHGKGKALWAFLLLGAALGLVPPTQVQAQVAGDERWTHSYNPMGVNDRVRAVLQSGGDVYAGGDFSTAGGAAAPVLARYRAATPTLPARWDTVATDIDGDVYVIVENPNDNTELFIGGEFTTMGGITVNGLARYRKSDGTITAVSSGVAGSVRAIAFNGTDMYVGGAFTSAGGQTTSNIAVYDLTNNAWRTLETGVAGIVNAIERIGRDIFVGGSFTSAGGETVNNIARWSINVEAWFPLENLSFTLGTNEGVTGIVYALTANGTDLYAAGDFTVNVDDGGITATDIAKWSTTTFVWEELSDGTAEGTDGIIYALDLDTVNDRLYAGGDFTMAGSDMVMNAGFWDITNETWNALGTNQLLTGVGGAVRALDYVSATELYLGGDFINVSGNFNVNRVANFHTTDDEFYGLGWGANGPIFASLILNDGTNDFLVVGGDFTAIGGMRANHVARLQISGGNLAWTRFAGAANTDANGVDGPVYALAASVAGAAGFNLHVGGNFDFMANASGLSEAANNVATWTAAGFWQATGTTPGTNGPVYALAVQNPAAALSATNILAIGGDFTSPDNYLVGADGIGNALDELSAGLNGPVYALGVGDDGTTDRDRLYVGGDFTNIGTTTVSNLAFVDDFDGTPAYEALNSPGDGTNGPVYAIEVADPTAALAAGPDARVYIGGDFSSITVNSTPTSSSHVVSLSGAAAAASLANATLRTVNGPVYALGYDTEEDDLWVGGAFTTAGDSTSNGVARAEVTVGGNSWYTLGTGTDNLVRTLSVRDVAGAGAGNLDDLFVGGEFLTAGNGTPTRSLAFYDQEVTTSGGGGGVTPTDAPVLYGPNASSAEYDFYAPETNDVNTSFPYNVTFAWGRVENAVGYKLFYEISEAATVLNLTFNDPNTNAVYTTDTTFTLPLTDLDADDNATLDQIIWTVCPTLDTALPTAGVLTHAGGDNIFVTSNSTTGDGPCTAPAVIADSDPGTNAGDVSGLILDLNEIPDTWPNGADRTFLQTTLDNTAGNPADKPTNFLRQGVPGSALTALVLPLGIDPQVGGSDIVNGDIIIPVFTDPADDELKAGGYGVWSGTDLFLTVYGDNPGTTVKEGFAAGEFMRFLVLRADDNNTDADFEDPLDQDLFIAEYEFENASKFFDPNVVYRFTSFNAVTEDQVIAEHLITLEAGWNLMSTLLNPNGDDGNNPDIDTNVSAVFVGAADSASTGFVSGAATNYVLTRALDGGLFYPQFGVNNVGFYDYREGYQVFMAAPDTLRITGAYPFGTERQITLPATSWYILPYLLNDVQPIDEVFGDATQGGGLTITAVRDNDGNAFIPGFGVNQIEFMRPGRAYWVYSAAGGTFQYPEVNFENPDSVRSRVSGVVADLGPAELAQRPSSYFELTRAQTGASATLVVQNSALRPGDEVAVRTRGGDQDG